MSVFRNPLPELRLTAYERIAGWLIFIICNFQIGSILMLLMFPAWREENNLYAFNVAMFIANAVLTAAVFFRTGIKGFHRLRQGPGRFFASYGIALGVYLISMQVVSIITGLVSSEIVNTNNDIVTEMIRQHPPMMILSTVVLAPLAEECFWRVLVFGELRQFNRWLAYAVSTLLFALLHVWQFIGEYSLLNLLMVTLSYLPAGAVLAWAYERSRSMWCSFLVHATINATVCVVTFLGL